jgi:hypothetical protein
METTATNTATPAFPIAGLLGLIFITLKLVGVISWSWWWVLAPFWIPFALMILIMIIVLLVILWKDKSWKRKN